MKEVKRRDILRFVKLVKSIEGKKKRLLLPKSELFTWRTGQTEKRETVKLKSF